MHFRFRASGFHLLFSAGVALIAAMIVVFVWYPPPYLTLAGGLRLFGILIGIDLVLGPLLTAIIASPSKPKPELRRDISLIVLVQLLAFAYGMYTIALARPVYLVFEVDRLQVVNAVDIDSSQLGKALPEYRQLPWTGPSLLSTCKAATQAEMTRSLDLGLQGTDVAMQPERWINFASDSEAVLQKARPAKVLLDRYPQIADQLKTLTDQTGVTPAAMYFLPMISRQQSGVAILASPDARFLRYMPVEGFF